MAFFSIDLSGQSQKYIDNLDVPVKEVSIGTAWSVYYDELLVSRVELHGWIFLWYGEFNAAPNFERVACLLDSGYFQELWGNRGVLIAIDRSTSAAYLFNDCYGSFPVYYSETESCPSPAVSSSIRSLSCSKQVDWPSFYQFLSFGYVFGGYSLYKGVSRLRANSYLKISFGNDALSIGRHDLKNFWVSGNTTGKPKLDDLIDILREEAEGFDNTQIMMSGGWDSRLVLSILKRKEPTLFTHGNLNSREIQIVKDIASFCQLPLKEQSISDIDFNVDLFSRYLFENDSAMFTHWSAAGLYARENNLIMTAGTFGEVLGGHYGTLNALKGGGKYASLLMHTLGLGGVFDKFLGLGHSSVVLNHLKMKSYGVFWFLNKELLEVLRSKNLIEESNRRLLREFEYYREQGMENAQEMFERFYTEHRGGQYINLQLTNSSSRSKYRNIFTNKDLIHNISSISFGDRAHNKINKKIINKLSPQLLRYPMAATLVNADRPLLIQEGSRAVRKVIENNPHMSSLYRCHARYGNRSFGWNNFKDVVNGNFIEKLSPLLGQSLWDLRKIEETINADKTTNMYPLFDMVSKAITLNHIVGDAPII
ncbi:hypothetical protein EHN06_11515 [Marinobacter sp. NP-4(2019)]|uniref:hypothetical protein n=1 Tax=Marinobacter sp. NP-4(2019) TaxID=2488665 RepID=UPI000FC3E19D|nr:hypothetical protein [Marinobacter sp. NP-4(2019)]AZT84114.1 hypothetical protein EHN06_11515 [Marinobacter sp. NP-4(2019)]